MFIQLLPEKTEHSKGVLPTHFRHLTEKICILFLVIHFLFIFIFYFTDIKILSLANLCSVFTYYVALWLLRKNYINLAFFVISIEVIIHAYFCSQFLGDAGFTDALLFLPVLFFVHPFASIRIKISYALTIILIYITIRYNDHFHTPLYDLQNNLLDIFAVGTSVLIIVIDSYIAYYAYKIIQNQNDVIIQKQKL